MDFRKTTAALINRGRPNVQKHHNVTSLLKRNSAVCFHYHSTITLELKEFKLQTMASVAGELLGLQNILHCS